MSTPPKSVQLGAPHLGSTSRLHAPGVAVHRALPTEHKFYDTIGRVVSEAAHLERMLDLIIWEFLGEAAGAKETSKIVGPKKRFDLIVEQSRKRGVGNTLILRAENLWKRTSGPMKERNNIVHDPWYIADRSKKLAAFRVPKDDPARFGMKDIKMAAINKTLRDLSKRRQEVGKLRSDIMTKLAAMREKKKRP